MIPLKVDAAANTLKARTSQASTELFWGHAAVITEVNFENAISVPGGVTSWDVSQDSDGTVMAYIIDDGLGTSTYKLYIQSTGNTNANPISSYYFQGFTKLTAINGISLLNTSSVTSMLRMFGFCETLTSLDVSNF